MGNAFSYVVGPFIDAPTVLVNGVEVPVYVDGNVDVKKAMESTVFTNWIEQLHVNGDVVLEKITIKGVSWFGPRIGFMFLSSVAKKKLPDGRMVPVPGDCFLRGDAVAVLILIKDVSNGRLWVPVTRQARVPVGFSMFSEIPAGMLDGAGSFAGQAAKEIQEETGIQIKKEDLCLLHDKLQYPSPGGCNEGLWFYYALIEMTTQKIRDLTGKVTGNAAEKETILVDVVPFLELTKSQDMKAHCAARFFKQKHPGFFFTV